MTFVSVAIATYDGERHVLEQLESISGQTLRPLELIVCDDLSTDRTVAIVEDFARRAPFSVRLHINEQRLGVGGNFMKAAGLCAGELIAFSDQDDVWLPHKLERCTARFEDPNVVLAIHACSVVGEEIDPQKLIVPAGAAADRVAPPLELPKWGEAPGMAMVFRRGLLLLSDWESRPVAHHQHGRLLHDEWVYGLARVAGSVAFIAEPLCLYRQHEANVEGAPERGAATWAKNALTTGGVYYGRRAEQARQWAALIERVAQRSADEELAGRSRREAVSYRRLAQALEQRALVYGPEESRRERLRALVRAFAGGTYRSRRREGFGLRGLTRDIAMIASGRIG